MSADVVRPFAAYMLLPQLFMRIGRRAPLCLFILGEIEMAVIYGDDLANDLSGTAGADTIYGLGGDDTLTGGKTDSLFGGGGDDVYNLMDAVVPSTQSTSVRADQRIHENVGEGYDVLNINVMGNYWAVYLPENVEESNVRVKAGYIIGTDKDEIIRAYDGRWSAEGGVSIQSKGGDDILYGTDFADELDGGAGADGMLGGKGDDIYHVNDRGDIVIEFAGEGYDEVWCEVSGYKLGPNLESMFVNPTKFMSVSGNGLDNLISVDGDFSMMIRAGAGNDMVFSSRGVADDIYIGGSGNDTLQAGLGNDVYRTSGDFGRDEITDAGGDDAVEFDVNENTLWFSKNGNDLSVSVIGTQNGVTIKNWYSDSSAKIEEFYAGTGKMLTAAKVDSLVNAMSAFTQPTSTALPANIQTALAPTLAAAWQ